MSQARRPRRAAARPPAGASRVLVDSSVWIEYYRPAGPSGLRVAVQDALERDRVVTAGVIAVEVLQGARTDADYALLERDFAALPWLELTAAAARQAARLGFDLRRRGLAVPAVDLVIAALALVHECELWHLDAHFERVQTVAPLTARRPVG